MMFERMEDLSFMLSVMHQMWNLFFIQIYYDTDDTRLFIILQFPHYILDNEVYC